MKSQLTELTERIEKILEEGAIGAAQAGRIIGEALDGRVVSPPTIIRLRRHGTRLPDGRIVKLETIRWAGKILTSRQAIVRFLVAQNEAVPADQTTPQSPRARRIAADVADRELDALGVR